MPFACAENKRLFLTVTLATGVSIRINSPEFPADGLSQMT
jgi:hypothetical protein